MKNNIDKVLKEHKGFFAFGNKQFEEAREVGVKYTSLGNGLLVPTANVKQFLIDFENVAESNIKKDIKENGIKNIIWRELANYEAQISMDITDTVEALKSYGISRKDIAKQYKAYFNNCIELDLF